MVTSILCSPNILDIPPEIVLHIYSYLDLPDLASLARVSPYLRCLASDPILHKNRIRIVAPSRVNHSLFGQTPQGPLRPTVGDLIQRGVMRGLNIERRWRMGLYFYSSHSVKQYEMGLLLERRHTDRVLSSLLRLRASSPNSLKYLHQSHVLPDVESSSLSVSRSLLPVMHKLKWSLQRDKLARMVRTRASGLFNGTAESSSGNFGKWLESKGKSIVQDGERVRLALCPGIRRIVGFYEDLES